MPQEEGYPCRQPKGALCDPLEGGKGGGPFRTDEDCVAALGLQVLEDPSEGTEGRIHPQRSGPQPVFAESVLSFVPKQGELPVVFCREGIRVRACTAQCFQGGITPFGDQHVVLRGWSGVFFYVSIIRQISLPGCA